MSRRAAASLILGLVFAAAPLGLPGSGPGGDLGGAAHAASCATAKFVPTFELIINPGTVKYDFTRSAQEISAMRGAVGENDGGGRQAGLTRSQLGFEVRVGVQTRGAAGAVCGYLQDARVSIGFQEFEVFVSRRYAEGSCAHGVTLAHENEHVAANRAALRQAEPGLRERLKAAVAEAPIMQGATAEQVRSHHLKRMSAILDESLAPITADARKRNAALDTPEKYRALGKRCARW